MEGNDKHLYRNLQRLQHSFSPPNPPQALATYGSDSQMTSLLNTMDVYVLPVFNVDGYEYTHKTVCYNFRPKFTVWPNRNHAVLFISKNLLICLMRVWHVYFVHFGDFRTGCGGKLAPGTLDPAAMELIPTGTSTLAGAVSQTYIRLYLKVVL